MTSPSLSRRSMLIGAAGLAAAGALPGCRPSRTGGSSDGSQTHNWDMTITIGNTSTWWAGAEAFQKALADKSQGRITLNLFANEQLSGGDPAAGIEMLQNNQKAFSYNSTIIYAGLDERFGAVNAPFLYTDQADADTKLPTAAEAYKHLCQDMNIKMLGFGESGFRQVTNNIRPIKTPSDLAGIKIRIPGITLFQDIFREMGANATTMNFSEVFTALQQGTIDGQENPIEVTHSSGLTQVQKYMTNWNYVYDPLILGMSTQLWESLSSEDQEIVQASADEANIAQIKATRDKVNSNLAEMSQKMAIIELDAAALQTFRAAMVPVFDKYRSVWGEKLLASVGYQG